MRLNTYLEHHPEIGKVSEANIRVKVVGPENIYDLGSYKGKYVGCYGTLERSMAGVRLDNKTNKSSGYGLFWFDRNELEVIEDVFKEENKMASAITGNYQVAVVKYVDGFNTEKEYNFALFQEDGGNFDHYLVKDTNGYHVVKLIKIVSKDEATHAVTQEIICPVDFSHYNKRVEDRAAKKKLKSKMGTMLKEDQDMLLYQAIAEKNPAMAELLKAYQALGDI